MRSAHADEFNHDRDASFYDRAVADESHPVRTGYRATLEWVGSRVSALAPPAGTVLDLGSGTGNTILALPPECRVIAVDVSRRMAEIARDKLHGRAVTFVQDDLLHYVSEQELTRVDAVVSTYTLHHLAPDERRTLFGLLRDRLRPEAPVIVGDLMYRNEGDLRDVLDRNRAAHPALEQEIGDEFLWNVEESREDLERLGWRTSWKRFSDLSWGAELTRG